MSRGQEAVTADLNIRMAGIDYSTASVGQRERFALTKTAQTHLLQLLTGMYRLSGCVVISTCNRMELWVSGGDGGAPGLADMLCDFFSLERDSYGRVFTERDGMTAVRHLFELACGLKSLVFGEDQILAQVKDALLTARECRAADPVLEALFRSAVTAAKKVKTQVRLYPVDRSVAGSAVALAKACLGTLRGVSCLVIGSGEMGRLAARELADEGCRVTMTLRRYRPGETTVPSGCNVVDYEARYAAFAEAGVIVSATRSPHFTLQYDRVRELTGGGSKVILDLALPRDVDPEIARLPDISLYDIDHFKDGRAPSWDGAGLSEVDRIIGEEIGEFTRWYGARALLPKINEITARAASDVEGRLRHRLRKAGLDEDSKEDICRLAVSAVERVVRKTMLGMSGGEGPVLREDPADGGAAAVGRPPLRFPLYVDLTGKEIAVIGAGAVALRRVQTLSAYRCAIRVTAPEACPEIRALHARGRIVYARKAYEPSDLDGAFLVIAATDSRELNHRISLDAGKDGRYCSVADCREECTFFFPATVRYSGGVIGICGTGEDHAGTKRMADDIREFIKEKERL